MTADERVKQLEQERLTGMPRWDITVDAKRRLERLEAVAIDEWLKARVRK